MRISDWSSDVCSSDLIKVGAATPQLPIATNLIPAPVAAEASLTAQKMPGVDAAQIGATVLGEPDADISGAAPDITPAIQPKAIPGQNPPATQADKQVQTDIEIPAKFAQTASNVTRSEERRVGKECVSTCRSSSVPDK